MTTPPTAYRADIDGLRALAILPVIIFHAQASFLPGGYLGVDSFFVISGYLIAGLILKALAEGRFSFREFYIRRMKRLLPAYFLMTLSVLLAGYLLLMPKEFEPVLRTALFGAISASNFSLATEGDYFSPDAELNPLLHTWSLAIEEQFYLVFPLLAWMMWRRSRGAFVVGLSVITALSLAHGLSLSMSESSWAHFSPLARAWQLCSGCLLAIFHLHAPVRSTSSAGSRVLSSLALATISAAMVFLPKDFNPTSAAVMVVGATLTLIHTGRTSDTLTARLLAHRLPVGVGLISYSTYLWHQPLIAFSKLFPGMHGFAYVGAILLASTLVGYLSWRFVETPLRHWKGGVRRTILVCALCMSYISGISIIGLKTSGFDSRFRAEFARLGTDTPDDIKAKRCGYYGNRSLTRDRLCEFPPTVPVGGAGRLGTIALWGDSHAAALSAGLIHADRPFPYIQLAFHGCYVAPDVGRLDKPMACLEKGALAEHEVMSRADISTVVIHAKWLSSLSDAPTKNGLSRQESTHRFLKKLSEAGKKVILVRSVPVHHVNVPAAAIRSERLGLDPQDMRSMKAHLSKEEPADVALDAWANEFGFVILDTTDLFCDEITDECPALTKDGAALYYDDDHLTAAGSRPLADRVVTAVLASME